MHELGTVFYVIREVEQVVEENHLTKVASVTLEIGEVSGIIPYYLTDCWQWAIQKSQYLKEAELKIETVPAVTFCEDCKQTYPTVKYAKICPHCKSEHTYLVSGNEYNIKEIPKTNTENEKSFSVFFGIYHIPTGARSIGSWMISSFRSAAYSSVRAVPPGRPSKAAMRMREASTM